jgi:acetylornithine deacetylase/succinyl-diaminopimelate desuccinylase-like protein
MDGRRLVGRGAVDMKGAVADEELAGIHGTKELRDRGLLDQDAAIVGEPSDLQLGLAQRGGAWLTATAFGKAVHGSQPHLGVNAITSMARLLLRLSECLPDREHPLAGRPTVNAAIISGGSAPNVVPDRCSIDIDRRVIPGETDPDAILAPFRRVIAEIRVAHPEVDIYVQVREWTDAAESPSGTTLTELARAAVAVETGSPPADVGFTGITDARYYRNDARMPTVILGPGSLSVAHTADEWVAVDDLVAAARTYARLAVAYLGTA